MELKEGDILQFKEKSISHILITVKGIDCNRRVRYVYGTVHQSGDFYANEKDILKGARVISKLEAELT